MGTYSNYPKIIALGVVPQAQRMRRLLRKHQLSDIDNHFIFERLFDTLIEQEYAERRRIDLIDDLVSWIHNEELSFSWYPDFDNYPDKTYCFNQDRALIKASEFSDELHRSFKEIYDEVVRLKMYDDGIIMYEYVDYLDMGNIIIEFAR